MLKAAYLFDSKSGQLTQGGTVVVEGDKIVSIGGTAPANAKVIDLGDATLLPGFIDAHTHLDGQFQKDFYKAFYEQMLRFPVEQAHTPRSTRSARSKRASPRCATSAPVTSSTSDCAMPSTTA